MNAKVKREDLGVRVVRVHIDHLDNEDGRVWAVDCRPVAGQRRRYLRVTTVLMKNVEAVITQVRKGKRQPRAWLGATGHVVMMTYKPTGTVVVTIRRP